jgi:hypothetical protein
LYTTPPTSFEADLRTSVLLAFLEAASFGFGSGIEVEEGKCDGGRGDYI